MNKLLPKGPTSKWGLWIQHKNIWETNIQYKARSIKLIICINDHQNKKLNAANEMTNYNVLTSIKNKYIFSQLNINKLPLTCNKKDNYWI